MQLFTNNAESSLDGAISSVTTAITVKVGEGGKFPSPGSGDFFLVTLFQKTGATELNHEIVRCTSRTGDVLTVARGQEGTVAKEFNNGDAVELRLTAGTAASMFDTAAVIHAASSKTTPADADELGLSDSAASWALKKLTFANLKAWIGGLFVSKSGDTMTGALGIGTSSPQAPLAISNGGAAGLEFFANYPGGGVGTYIQSYNRSAPGYVDTVYDALSHSFRTQGTERLRIGVDGVVGIGGNLNVPSINGGQLAGFRNKIINGKMEIAQRGTSFAAIASSSYSLDRWVFGNTSSAVLTASQQTDVPIGNEFQSSLRFAVTTADSSIAAGDVCWVNQRIEGYNARDLIGRTFTLSFWVRSSKTGVHCVALKNGSADRTYLAEYTVNVANTWEQKSIAITGGLITAGTWDWTNGVGLRVDFALACGTTFQAPPGSWQTGDFYATSSQVNCLDTIDNVFAITGVQLEVGSVATPFEHRPYGLELALCQRYYRVLCTPGVNAQYVIGSGMMLSTTAPKFVIRLDQPMRTTPSFSISSAGHFTVFAGGATSTLNSFVISGQSDASNIALDGVTSAGLTNAAAALIYTNVTTAIAALSAEL